MASAPTWAAAEPRPPVSLRFGHLVLGGDAGPWRRCGLDGLISKNSDSEWLHTANGSLTWASDREGLGWGFHDDDAAAAYDIRVRADGPVAVGPANRFQPLVARFAGQSLQLLPGRGQETPDCECRSG